MSTIRLTFLYPHLFRSTRLGESAVQAANSSRRKRPSVPAPSYYCQRAAPFATSTPPRRSGFAPRHGKGVEPTPVPEETKSAAKEDVGLKREEDQRATKSDEIDGPSQGKAAESKAPENATSSETKTADAAQDASKVQAEATTSSQDAQAPTPEPPKGKSGPMDAILYMGPPEELKNKPPHLTPPPYVHHFDSYSLVKQLEEGGYTQKQAITAMKAVRSLLAQNLDVAQDGLVSKHDVENETYLFRAACSELSSEVRKSRRADDEHMRVQRTLLQHEVDILTQSLSQEVLKLNDSVRGAFNDRKMAVREEQKAAESAIQSINYKISVELNSDAKSEIEGLRWVLIRRSVLGIIFMAFLALGTLRYASYVSHERQQEAERAAREADARTKNNGNEDVTASPAAAEILAAN